MRSAATQDERVPLRDVHAEHDEPERKAQFRREPGHDNRDKSRVCQTGSEDQRKGVDHVADAGKRHEHAERLGQIGRSKDQIPKESAAESKRYEGDTEAVVVLLERCEYERLELLRFQGFEITGATQKDE